jgi:oxygen-independent coproporphyrinogen-3 oxidase
LCEGIDVDALAERFGLGPIVNWPKVDRLVASGHLARTGGRIAPTAAGRLLLDYVLGEIAVTAPTSEASGLRPVSVAAA